MLFFSAQRYNVLVEEDIEKLTLEADSTLSPLHERYSHSLARYSQQLHAMACDMGLRPRDVPQSTGQQGRGADETQVV